MTSHHTPRTIFQILLDTRPLHPSPSFPLPQIQPVIQLIWLLPSLLPKNINISIPFLLVRQLRCVRQHARIVVLHIALQAVKRAGRLQNSLHSVQDPVTVPVLKSPSANSNSDVPAPTPRGQPLSPRDHGHHQAQDRHDFSNVPPGSPSFSEDAIDKVAPFPETTTIREDIPRLPEAQNTIPIDPAIVFGDATHEGIQLERATADSSQVIDGGRDTARSSPDPLASDLHPIPECHRSVSKEAEPLCESITPRMIGSSYGHGHDPRLNQHSRSDIMRVGIASSERDHDGDSTRGGPTSGKRSSRTRQSLGRPAKRPRTGAAPHEGRGSFLTLRSHFFTLPFEERLQFLSWPFEGALSHCMPESLGAFNVSSTTGKTGTDDMQLVSPRTRPYGTAPTLNANDEPPLNLRKHRQWTSEEVDLLVKLRKEQKLPWSEVAKGFAEQFPGRTQGSIQVYWCTKLKDRH